VSFALPHFPALTALPPLEHPDLMAPGTAAAIAAWFEARPEIAGAVGVAAIDPALSDTAALTEAYDLPPEASVNCVVVSGKREGVEKVAAAVVRADTRADVNNMVRRLLNVRKASFMPMDQAVERSGMEYGGITPLGLPAGWRILVDRAAIGRGEAIIGSGVRGGKIVLPGALLGELPGAEVVDGLAL
jgi:prolyl-tRNA editing enzyme YbaK/EbsC (Cys-tRNA(Pro) deacylase)